VILDVLLSGEGTARIISQTRPPIIDIMSGRAFRRMLSPVEAVEAVDVPELL